MEIDSSAFIEIFQKNFHFKIVDTPLGKGVRMDPLTAFVFSNVTGYGYLDNHVMPYSPKYHTKVLYNALDFNFVSGLYNQTSLYNTPHHLFLERGYLFDSDKIIVPIEFERDVDLQKHLRGFIKSNKDHTNYIIARIEVSKKGNGMEPFMEYLSCEYFKNNGFLVENQIPLGHSSGSPDFAGYKFQYNNNSKYFIHSANLIQLAMIRVGMTLKTEKTDNRCDFIVGEVKTSTTEMKKQLEKYTSTGLFNSAYEIHPSKPSSSSENFGLLNIGGDFRIGVLPPNLKLDDLDCQKQKKYNDWLLTYIKLYLFANFTNAEFSDYYSSYFQRPIESTNDIVDFANRLSIDDILDRVLLLA